MRDASAIPVSHHPLHTAMHASDSGVARDLCEQVDDVHTCGHLTHGRTHPCVPTSSDEYGFRTGFCYDGINCIFSLACVTDIPVWSTHTGLTLSLFKDISASKKTFSYAETRRKIVHGDMTGVCACVCVRVGVLAGTEH